MAVAGAQPPGAALRDNAGGARGARRCGVSKTGKSILISGVYYGLSGLLLLLLPHTFLKLFSVPNTEDLFVRLAGLLLFFLGYYYVRGALAEDELIFRCTLFDRVGGAVVMALFVVFGYPLALLLFTVIDLVLALATVLLWRAELKAKLAG